MIDNITYALMAGDAYISTRADKNQFPIPDGWTEFFHQSLDSGFEAVTFTNGTDIVISYAGTYDNDIFGDVAADIALGTGLLSAQLFQAAEYYMKVKADNSTADFTPNITLTGHSLGGGLASLIAVFFNETAVTFDQAPFRNSASWMMATELRVDLALKYPVSIYPQISTWLDPLDRFISSFDPLGLGWSTDGLAARETKVTNLSVQGEFLSAANLLRIGTELTPLAHGDYFAPLNLHSQALLSAFLQSERTASVNPVTQEKDTLGKVTYKLTDLLKMIFDEKLFAYTTDPTNTKDENLLERLVKHEAGALDLLTGTAGNDVIDGKGGDDALSGKGGDKWRSAAQLAGVPIFMRLPEAALPRSSLHAVSRHAPNQPASDCTMHAAQNNSLWEIAA